MSENITTTPTATTVRPIPSPAPAVEPAKTPEMQKCARCQHNYFVRGGGKVPGLVMLYGNIRGTEVQKSKPLTDMEVMNEALCGHCSWLANFKTYPTSDTIRLMAKWRMENKEWAAKREARKAE